MYIMYYQIYIYIYISYVYMCSDDPKFHVQCLLDALPTFKTTLLKPRVFPQRKPSSAVFIQGSGVCLRMHGGPNRYVHICKFQCISIVI